MPLKVSTIAMNKFLHELKLIRLSSFLLSFFFINAYLPMYVCRFIENFIYKLSRINLKKKICSFMFMHQN